jgi:hypothetical protein
MSGLPDLDSEALRPTRDLLRDQTRALGSLQRAFLPKNEHDWHYGLEVGMRGPCTQEFTVNGRPVRAVMDLVRHRIRLPEAAWSMAEYDGPGLLSAIYEWLANHGEPAARLEAPKFLAEGKYRDFDAEQAGAYAAALWWLHKQLQRLSGSLAGGLKSPVLLYPHHFDLAFTWFPWSDDRQVSAGFSTSDDSIAEAYIYLTAYPEPPVFKTVKLPAEAGYNTEGFNGAVLPYKALSGSAEPEKLLDGFVRAGFTKSLFD